MKKINFQNLKYHTGKQLIRINNHLMQFLISEMHFINRINLKMQANNSLRISNLNEDKDKKSAGFYNLGNSFLKANKVKESIEAYKEFS